MKKLLLASSWAVALVAASPALAQDWNASIDGDYIHANANNGGGTADGYDINGAADIPFSWSPIGVELLLGYHSLDGAHDFNGGGNFIWNGMNLRLAATVTETDVHIGGTGISEWELGGGADWYANSWLTLSGQGGGIAGKLSGGYVGGTAKGYVMPDLSLAGFVNYTGVSLFGANLNETDFGVKGEWMISDTFPLSINGGYFHSNIDTPGPSVDVDTFFVGAKFYLNGGGAMPLVERNRTGTLDTIGAIHPLIFSF